MIVLYLYGFLDFQTWSVIHENSVNARKKIALFFYDFK